MNNSSDHPVSDGTSAAGEGWPEAQTVETAVGYTAQEDHERILVYVVGYGWQMGVARKYPSVRTVLKAEGFNGNFQITHWMRLPPPLPPLKTEWL